MMKPDFIFYQLPKALAAKACLPRHVLPIRKGREGAIFGSRTVHLESLIEEIEAYVTLYPEKRNDWWETAVQLAFLAAHAHAATLDFKAALVATSSGLRVAPEASGLRLHQAFALQICGYAEAAASEYRGVFDQSPEAIAPVAAIMCAKALREAGRAEEAADFLLGLPDEMLAFEEVRHLAEHYVQEVERSDVGSDTDTATGAEIEAEATAVSEPAKKAKTQRFCTKCGASLKPQKKFCTACGAPIKT